jgi:hypothetical protein
MLKLFIAVTAPVATLVHHPVCALDMPLPHVSLRGKEKESAGWTLEGCKMNEIHRTEKKHRGREGNRCVMLR